MTLEGATLCERQRNLNFRVKEAAEKNVSLQETFFAESPDVDRIFKIDLASKYKNIDYIIEALKSGDSLYISRALKCEWMYSNEYAHIINPDYLQVHIFPMVSPKMKKKILSTIPIYLRDEARAQVFYEYCTKANMHNIASKFLLITSFSYKKELLEDDHKYCNLHFKAKKTYSYVKYFIGNSFDLADMYWERGNSVMSLSYLYSIDSEKFLDFFEKYTDYYYGATTGVKMSRTLMKKHKDRVLKNPVLYISVINGDELIRYSSSEDAKVYAIALLPEHAHEFWRSNYYWTYKHILELVKPKNMYQFVKTLFCNKYPDEPFEMSYDFYHSRYYEMMTFEERETWALKHLNKKLGVIPEEDDYKWYEYVRFSKAFEEIRKQIMIACDIDKRLEFLEFLVKCAKTQKELEEVLNYFYKRHINEEKDKKEQFLYHVTNQHKVLEFGEACWCAFDKILHSLGLYISDNEFHLSEFVYISLVYHIVNGKTFPNGLFKHLENADMYSVRTHCNKLNDEQKTDIVRKFVYQYLTNKINEFETKEYNDDIKSQVYPYLSLFRDWYLSFYDQGRKRNVIDEKEKYPDIALKYMELNGCEFEDLFRIEEKKPKKEKPEYIEEGSMIRLLKENAALVLEKLPLLKDTAINRCMRINSFLRKMKIYFSNDIAKQYLEFCTTMMYTLLTDKDIECTRKGRRRPVIRYRRRSRPNHFSTDDRSRFVNAVVFAIFQLGDEKLKIEIMEKFAPKDPKIEHDKIDEHILRTQEAICRFHCYSRPPLPFSKTALYIKGDYVHKCDEMFDKYLANLTPTKCKDFIDILLDNPLSIQKRGLRLANLTFGSNELIQLFTDTWMKTKNVSLRKILYTFTFNKVSNNKEAQQKEYFELLKKFTETLHEEDDDGVFNYLCGRRLPDKFLDSYLQTAWKTVVALPDKKPNFNRRTLIMEALVCNISLMNDEFLTSLIKDHVQNILIEQKLRPEPVDDIVRLNTETWNLAALYIVNNPDETKLKKTMELVKLIVEHCLDNWNEDHGTTTFIIQSFFQDFISNCKNHISYTDPNHVRTFKIFEYLLERFGKKLKLPEMYSSFWDWKLMLLTKAVVDNRDELDKEVYVYFGLKLGIFIKELKDTNRFYFSYFNEIVEKVSEFSSTLEYMRSSRNHYQDLDILVAYGLSLTHLYETSLLALRLLPEDPCLDSDDATEFLEVIYKIKQQNNDDLTSLMYQKYIKSNMRVRKFVF